MGVTVYKSSDGSAPTLNGQAGSLLTVLGKCLVDGYGAKAAAGWTRAFADAGNIGMFQNAGGAVGTLKMCLNIVDNAPRASPFNDGREARFRCGEGATNVSTLTNGFAAANYFQRKSFTADATARNWIVIADARTVIFLAQTGDYGSSGYSGFYAGEFYSIKSTQDNFNAIIIGRTIEQVAATPVAAATDEALFKLSALNVATVGHTVPRSWDETQQLVAVSASGNPAHSAASLFGLCNYPNPVDSAIELSQITLCEAATFPVVRGRLRGLWHWLHPLGSNVRDGDTFNGTGSLAGKSFLIVKPVANHDGILVVETSNTWETN